jgi:nitrogen fixation-related uncharacterized protein
MINRFLRGEQMVFTRFILAFVGFYFLWLAVATEQNKDLAGPSWKFLYNFHGGLGLLCFIGAMV